MRYIFYADVYFIQNFIIKVAVLFLVLYGNRHSFSALSLKKLGKISLAAATGTLIEVIGLLFSSSYIIFVFLVHLFEVPCMIWFVLGKAEKRIWRGIALGYFFIILINATLEVLWNYFGESGSYIFYLLFSIGIVIVGAQMYRNYTKIQKWIFDVKLLHQGKEILIKGFYDSGNRLVDPYTHKGVHIVVAELLRKLEVSGPSYIPYQSLGNETGLLEVYYIDELIVDGERGRIIIQNCPLGVTKDNLFEAKNYEIILNEEVF